MMKKNNHREQADFSQEHQTLMLHREGFLGKHVVVIADEIYELPEGERAVQLLDELCARFPGRSPLMTYVMTDEVYILWL